MTAEVIYCTYGQCADAEVPCPRCTVKIVEQVPPEPDLRDDLFEELDRMLKVGNDWILDMTAHEIALGLSYSYFMDSEDVDDAVPHIEDWLNIKRTKD